MFALLLMALLTPFHALAAEDDELLENYDRIWLSDAGQADVEMTVYTKHPMRRLKFTIWQRGADLTKLMISEPKEQAGMATLRIENQLYQTLTKGQVIQISRDILQDSWMGSHFTNDDLIKVTKLRQDFLVKSKTTSRSGSTLIVTYQLDAKESSLSEWPRLELDFCEGLPKQQRFFGEKGQILRTIDFAELKILDGKKTPTLITARYQAKPEERTELRYLSLNRRAKKPRSFFNTVNINQR